MRNQELTEQVSSDEDSNDDWHEHRHEYTSRSTTLTVSLEDVAHILIDYESIASPVSVVDEDKSDTEALSPCAELRSHKKSKEEQIKDEDSKIDKPEEMDIVNTKVDINVASSLSRLENDFEIDSISHGNTDHVSELSIPRIDSVLSDLPSINDIKKLPARDPQQITPSSLSNELEADKPSNNKKTSSCESDLHGQEPLPNHFLNKKSRNIGALVVFTILISSLLGLSSYLLLERKNLQQKVSQLEEKVEELDAHHRNCISENVIVQEKLESFESNCRMRHYAIEPVMPVVSVPSFPVVGVDNCWLKAEVLLGSCSHESIQNVLEAKQTFVESARYTKDYLINAASNLFETDNALVISSTKSSFDDSFVRSTRSNDSHTGSLDVTNTIDSKDKSNSEKDAPGKTLCSLIHSYIDRGIRKW